jgi:ribonuclease VapC
MARRVCRNDTGMIVVDTSALMAIRLGAAEANAVMQAVEDADGLCMSAAMLAAAMIVAERRGVGAQMAELVEGLGVEIVTMTASDARAVAKAYRKWGKGAHHAGLNFGDCFAYALATLRDCPILYVGADFARTDAKPLTSRRRSRAR